MPLSDGTSSWPLAYDTQPVIDPEQPMGDPTEGEYGDRLWNYAFAQLARIQAAIGLADGSVSGSIYERLGGAGTVGTVGSDVIDVTTWGIKKQGEAGENPATNAAIFNFSSAAHDKAARFYFPPGTYRTTGFVIQRDGQRIVGAGAAAASNSARGTTIVMTGTGAAITIAGNDSGGGYGSRVFGCGIENVFLKNSGTGTNIATKIHYATGMEIRNVWYEGFRGDGGAIHAHDFADSLIDNCCFDFCGSADGTNKAVVKFTGQADAGETSYWGADEIRFVNCRFENNSDRLVHFAEASGFREAKIRFVGCKFENSLSNSNGLNGSNDTTTQAQFLIENGQWIIFDGCDFTLQNRQSAFVLDTVFRLTGSAFVCIVNSEFQMGSGSFPKCFNYYIRASDANALVVLSNVWLNCGNSTAFPTQVLKATNSPRLAQRMCGFTPTQGGSKVATDWYTSGEWSSGGVVIP